MRFLFLSGGVALAAALTGLAGNVGVARYRAAAAVVAARHAEDRIPAGRLAVIAETVREAGTRPLPPAPVWTSLPPAPTGDDAGGYDRETLAELKREGIDLSAIRDIRDLMRRALTDPDPARRLALAEELKVRFGLDADQALLGRLERAGDGGVRPAFTARGSELIRKMTERTSAMYDELLKLF